MYSLLRSILFAVTIALGACGQSATPASTESNSAALETTTASTSAPAMAVGACVDTTVQQIGTRLENTPGSGSAITYANGVYQVSYDAVPGIDHSQVGDAVHVCLVSVPPNCPPGDERGKMYSAVNQRTHETWSAMDAEHMCGGA